MLGKTEGSPIREIQAIVPSEDVWMRIPAELWKDGYAKDSWNDMMSACDVGFSVIVVTACRLPTRLKSGFVYRPVGCYKDFSGNPIYIKRRLNEGK